MKVCRRWLSVSFLYTTLRQISKISLSVSRSYSPLGEIELEAMEQGLEQQDNSMGSMASEDDMDPDYIPDGQAEWVEMERKAGRFYD